MSTELHESHSDVRRNQVAPSPDNDSTSHLINEIMADNVSDTNGTYAQHQIELEPAASEDDTRSQGKIGSGIDEDTELPYERNDEGGCCSSLCTGVLYALSILVIICTVPFSLFACIKIVQEYERAAIFRLGRAMPGAKGPGMFFIVPCVENFVKVDLRTLSFDVPPQEILTKDSVTVAVDAVVYYRIFKPMTSVIRVQNAYHSTLLLAQTTLRTVLGTKELREVLSQREEIQHSMLNILEPPTDEWGVRVERIELKDVRLPEMMQRAMAKEAEANRDAQAKIIAADGEKQAARSLKEAALVMSENKSALQLRYLQTLGHIATENHSTIYFPLPLDSIGGDMSMKK